MNFITKIKQWLDERDLKKRQFKALSSGTLPRRQKRKYENKHKEIPHEHTIVDTIKTELDEKAKVGE